MNALKSSRRRRQGNSGLKRTVHELLIFSPSHHARVFGEIPKTSMINHANVETCIITWRQRDVESMEPQRTHNDRDPCVRGWKPSLALEPNSPPSYKQGKYSGREPN
ncbi:hypothetical protein RRG08_020970 [Elysia crispata]|uniref:Uncharacterized protein n=1 Tax=Elysia crispata TaxID=231223 RepID=A0AAE1EC39_9GAST|nr:hypothetical protein RRG08_020970 [Elysia crispata]